MTVDVGVAAPPTQTFTITNRGGGMVTGLSASITPASQSDFAIVAGSDTCTGQSLNGGATCTIKVAFNPTAHGAKSATLALTGNPFSSASATLQGTGRDQLTLTVNKNGNGSGTVSAPAAGDVGNMPINCGPLCSDSFYRTTTGSVVTLTATPAAGSTLGGWSVPTCGTNATCAVTLGAAMTVTATFTAPQVTLSVTSSAVNGQAGVVSSSDGSIQCSPTCTGTYNSGAVVTLTPTPTGTSSHFLGWSGDCKGVTPTCTLTMTGNRTANAVFGPQTNYMFLTSTGLALPFAATGPAALTAADQHCQQLAQAAGMGGTSWTALLSNSTTNAVTRVSGSPITGWVRADGLPFGNQIFGGISIFDTGKSASNGTIYYPPRIDELGNDHGISASQFAATGTSSSGLKSNPGGGNWCSDYTAASATSSVVAGSWSSGSGAWVDRSQVPCTTLQFYCFQTDARTLATPLKPPPLPANPRYAFLTDGYYSVGAGTTGIAGLDADCQSEATQNGFAGTFQAFAAPDGSTSAISRFTDGSPWFRPDGVMVAPDLASLGAGALTSVINVTGTLLYRESLDLTWTGARSPTDAASPATCSGWSSATSTGYVGNNNIANLFFSNATPLCSTNALLYCLAK
jgi:hypothetical protein